LLFSIDDSQSMGDKQAYLQQAIPDLIDRLVNPNCLDANGNYLSPSQNDGQCPAGGQVEFPPVHDMHIGIVSSSLGPRLADKGKFPGTTCVGVDDGAHLVARSGATKGSTVAAAEPGGFLSWFPDVKENSGSSPTAAVPPVKDAKTLENDFEDMVAGVGQSGCGIESQLENWYRFLVQPDPYDHLDTQGTKDDPRAIWVGVDSKILAERKDFLRPDSLVVVVVLSDENDSEVDVRALSQTAFFMMSNAYPPPRGTTPCATNPNDPGCKPCDGTTAGDPNCSSCEPLPDGGAPPPKCAEGVYTQQMGWGLDVNLRHVHMKAKYGFDAQFPIERYATGLSSLTVPDRDGEYPAGAGSYVGDAKCTNPLFASSLPDGTKTDAASLCNLPHGARNPNQIYYAHIGGVPNQLLHFKPGDPKGSALSDDDWVKILGKDPEHYDYTGIDPHMIESVKPRAGLPTPDKANDAEPISGREWITDEGNPNPGSPDSKDLPVDLQYACTFPIAPRECTGGSNCDCSAQGIPHEQVSPVCDSTDINKQVKAKAYPTNRELLLAKLLKGQAIVSSICPIDTANSDPSNAVYGYRPAVAGIIDRLKQGLTQSCLPEPLDVDSTGAVECMVLAQLPALGGESACDPSLGLSVPDASILANYRATAESNWQANGGTASGVLDPAGYPVCQVSQLESKDLVGGSCKRATKPGWCYVTGANADGCAQEVLFSPNSLPSGSKVSLECLEAAGNP
jgi:hypothetical protein